MYQPQIGDRIRFMGYTPEAYKNGSVPTFVSNEGIVIDLDGKLYLKLDNEWVVPIYYLDNLELVQKSEQSSIYHELTKEDEMYLQLAGKPLVPVKRPIRRTEHE